MGHGPCTMFLVALVILGLNIWVMCVGGQGLVVGEGLRVYVTVEERRVLWAVVIALIYSLN